MAVEFPISRGLTAIVDEEDFHLVDGVRWFAKPTGPGGACYVFRSTSGKRHNPHPETGKRWRQGVYLHRLIMGATAGQIVDHINRDPLDNRRSNLRLTTKSLNSANSRHRANISGFRGVAPLRGRWLARICVQGKVHSLGTFDCRIEAAKVYDAAALKYFGEFAHPNFPEAA